MKWSLIFLAGLFVMVPSLQAAPIGIPGATVGADQSSVGLELSFLIDRDLNTTGDTEGMMVLTKGEVGISKRVDLLFRLGFGRFESGGGDSDAGLVFGSGVKVTWAAIPDLNIKIGSVAQMLQVRSDVNGDRESYTEYDLAIGAYLDSKGSGENAGNQAQLATYGGIAISSVDIENRRSVAKEDNSFGIFVGLLMNLKQGVQAGLEIRLLDQTALALSASYPF